MGLIATVTLVIAVLALCSVRHAWSIPWERPATLTVALLTLDVLLLAPRVSRWLSPKLHAFTGLWNLEDLIGHISVLIAMGSLLYLVASRLDMNPAQFRWFVRYRIELPCTIGIALMVAIFVAGDIADGYVIDTVAVHATPWLRAYWLTMSVACYYLIWNIGQALLILRRDPQSRRAATAYLAAVGISACCGIAFVLAIEPLQWLMVRAEVVGYAIAASYTWRSKVADLRR
ncbi:MAG: hypothetical protein WB785_22445 [Mycobacterium sp.]|uniref:hypothetical protein n=1 Tax=Mycobacterium sp. TaxID=1785 RepID=UPI003C45788B